jgi:cytochrome oxidase assembly protein ShyY1
MVNRGWIPSEKVPIELSCTDRKSDLVDIEAIVRKSDKRPLFVPENVPQQGYLLKKYLKF